MNTTEKIYERMIEKAVDLYKKWVTSNYKMRQLESAKTNLSELISSNGDTGIAYALDVIESEYERESYRNGLLCEEHTAYIQFVWEYARNVEELEGIELTSVEVYQKSALSDVLSELKQKERDCAEKHGVEIGATE